MIKKFLGAIPNYTLTFIWGLLAAVMLLNPSATGDGFVRLSDGWECLIHGMLGGVFVVCVMLDWQRKHGWTRVPWIIMVWAFVIVAGLTDVLKLLQIWWEFYPVKGVEVIEISAQTAGAFVFGLLYMVAQPMWCTSSYSTAGE